MSEKDNNSMITEFRGFTIPKDAIPTNEEFQKDPFKALDSINQYVNKARMDTVVDLKDYKDKKEEVKEKASESFETAETEDMSDEELNSLLFTNVVDDLADLYSAKNSDYGNAFTESFEEFGLLSFVIRLGDKYRRLKSLMFKDETKVAESVEDTIKDIANYAIMTLMEMHRYD